MSQRLLSRLLPAVLLLAVPALAADPSSPLAAPTASKPDAAPADAVDLATAKTPPTSDDLARQLADTQDKLTTALHSYSLLQDENTQLKAAADKSASDKAAVDAQVAEANNSITSLKSQAAAATQVDGLREQLRQSQNQIAALATENADLRTRLALSNSAAGSATFPGRPAPESIRPVEVASTPLPLPPAKKDAAKSDAGSDAKAGPRTYVVVAGDSLTKISKKCYGSANHWDKILAANRDVIKNENIVVVGSKLKIP